jgi:5-hydroxyisourate hydrolase-like protein (transthyretin family)
MGVSAEIMDSMFGCAAGGIQVTLLREVDAGWLQQASALTNDSGHSGELDTGAGRGRYRLALEFDRYFSSLGVEPFQSRVEITFRMFGPDERVHFLVTAGPSSIFVCRLATRTAAAHPSGDRPTGSRIPATGRAATRDTARGHRGRRRARRGAAVDAATDYR